MQLEPGKIEKIHLLVKEIEKYTQTINDSDKTKVILYGNPGCGKSSLLNALVQNELQIETNRRRVILDGRGICHNHTTNYRLSIEIDNESHLIFCEFPKIDYAEWYISNILDSYLIDKMLMKTDNKENKIKIILIANPEEITSYRGMPLNHLVKDLESIFPNVKTLMEKTALVISRCNEDDEYKDEHFFVKIIGKESVKCPDYSDDVYIMETNKWYHYLLKNLNQVFLFSSPSLNDVGKLYQFKKREELIEFLKKDPLVNPEIKYLSCEESLEMANLLERMHSDSVTEVIHKLFERINTSILNLNQDEIEKLINSMRIIISKEFNSYDDISQILREQIQNEKVYEIYYQQISEFHEFYSFLNKYLSKNFNDMKVRRELQLLASHTIAELLKMSSIS